MSNMEKKLTRMKGQLEDLHAPDDLEDRLNRALAKGERKRSKRPLWKMQVAMILMMFMLFGYHFNTLAYYSRTLLGYERIIDGALQELNELGKGQILDLTHEFNDGQQVTLEGIMMDGNQLLVFCRYYSPTGYLEDMPIQPDPFIRSSLGRYSLQSGAGVISEDGKEMKYVYHYEPPRPWDKTLAISFTHRDGAVSETADLRFALDRQKAMGYTLRILIRRDFLVGTGHIRILSLDASPTKTVIRGTVQGILGLAFDTLRGERFRPESMDLRLMVNGEEWPQAGGSMTTDHRGITFQRDYQALPEEILSLSLQLVSFQADHDVDEEIPLVGVEVMGFDVHGHRVLIHGVETTEHETRVMMTTSESLRLSRVYLMADGERVSLEETVDESLEKTPTGEVLRTRTLRFAGSGETLVLHIERIVYDTEYNQFMAVPLE